MKLIRTTPAVLLVAVGLLVYLAQPAESSPPIVKSPPPDLPNTADRMLEQYLKGWENMIPRRTSLRMEISLKRSGNETEKEPTSTGVVMWMKPSYVMMRLENADDPTKTDYESYLFDGKTLQCYSGRIKTILRVPVPASQMKDNLGFRFFSGPHLKDLLDQVDCTLAKVDEQHIHSRPQTLISGSEERIQTITSGGAPAAERGREPRVSPDNDFPDQAGWQYRSVDIQQPKDQHSRPGRESI